MWKGFEVTGIIIELRVVWTFRIRLNFEKITTLPESSLLSAFCKLDFLEQAVEFVLMVWDSGKRGLMWIVDICTGKECINKCKDVVSGRL